MKSRIAKSFQGHTLPEIASLLYVPGIQPKMLKKSLNSLASVLCPDLEDSVASQQKD